MSGLTERFLALIRKEVRCPKCRRLLLRGGFEGELKYPRCGWLLRAAASENAAKERL